MQRPPGGAAGFTTLPLNRTAKNQTSWGLAAELDTRYVYVYRFETESNTTCASTLTSTRLLGWGGTITCASVVPGLDAARMRIATNAPVRIADLFIGFPSAA